MALYYDLQIASFELCTAVSMTKLRTSNLRCILVFPKLSHASFPNMNEQMQRYI